MKSKFKLPIILLGIVIPLIFFLICIVGGRKAKANQVAKVDKRNEDVRKNLAEKKRSEALQVQVKSFDGKSEQWEKVFAISSYSDVSNLVIDASKDFDADQRFRGDVRFDDNASGLGAESKQESTTYTMTFTGTYQALQETLLRVETELPNFVLNRFTLTPDRDSNLLDMELSYSAWQKS